MLCRRKLNSTWMVMGFVVALVIINDQLQSSLWRSRRYLVDENTPVAGDKDREIKRIDKIAIAGEDKSLRKIGLKTQLSDSRRLDVDGVKLNISKKSDPRVSKKAFTVTESRSASCKPHEVVVFLKTHKTGGSTVTNILNRYADLRDLKVALPHGIFYRFRWPTPFHWSAVDLWRLDGDTPSVMCNHARYNRATMQLIMKKGAKYITILRNPADQYESMFNYMEFNGYLQLNNSKNPLADFLENPVPHLYRMREKFHGIPEPMNLVKNPMFFDLGMHPPAYDNMTRVKEEILKLERDFELVMIIEYFDESLILLKKAFCWQMIDIVYVKFMQRKKSLKVQLSQRERVNIQKWNKADVMLYDHFNKTLWKKIEDYGPSFWDDLAEFRQLNAKVQASCAQKRLFSVKTDKAILAFRLNSNVSNHDRYFCKKVIRNEVGYIKYFRKKYKPYGSYQNLLKREGKKKTSTRELIERLRMAGSHVKFASDSIPRAVS